MNARNWLSKSLCFSVVVACQPAWAAGISPGEIVGVLRAAKIVKADLPLRAAYSSGDCIVTTQRNPKATDNDCKIDAILIAKTLFDSFPDAGILHVKALFSDYGIHKYMEVSVSKSDVEAFGSRKLTQDELLKTIPNVMYDENVDPFAGPSASIESAAATSVVPGPLTDKRLILLGRIDTLKQHGVNTEMFIQAFQNIEDQVKGEADPSVIQGAIDKLNSAVDDQEKRRQDANKNNLRMEAAKFQAHVQTYVLQCAATNKPLPFSMNELSQVMSLINAGRYQEASAGMKRIEAKMR